MPSLQCPRVSPDVVSFNAAMTACQGNQWELAAILMKRGCTFYHKIALPYYENNEANINDSNKNSNKK